MQLTGIHHLTAVTGNAPRNHDFYTQTLGLRLVKKTVNQDDVSAYHLFYADGRGSPGTRHHLLRLARRAASSAARTASPAPACASPAPRRSPGGSSASRNWASRTPTSSSATAALTLDFEDFEGQRLSLVDDGGQGEASHPWERSPVPAEHQIRGLGPITISVPDLEYDRPRAHAGSWA